MADHGSPLTSKVRWNMQRLLLEPEDEDAKRKVLEATAALEATTKQLKTLVAQIFPEDKAKVVHRVSGAISTDRTACGKKVGPKMSVVGPWSLVSCKACLKKNGSLNGT